MGPKKDRGLLPLGVQIAEFAINVKGIVTVYPF